MGSIWCMMGKSSSGKDTLFEELRRCLPDVRTIVPYTTRPIREGEQQGVTYFFVSPETLQAYDKAGKVIELRSYDTVHGVWQYATIADGQIDLENHDYLVIGTLASYQKLKDYYGPDRLQPLYIEVPDGVRLQRALHREQQQATPSYEELCRRFLADCVDFSEEALAQAGIHKRYHNDDKEPCLAALIQTMGRNKHNREEMETCVHT